MRGGEGAALDAATLSRRRNPTRNAMVAKFIFRSLTSMQFYGATVLAAYPFNLAVRDAR